MTPAGIHGHLAAPPVNNIQWRTFFGRSRHGLSTSIPRLIRMSRRFWPPQAVGQAAMARSRMVFEGSGTIEASVTSWMPAEAVAARTGPLRRVGREGFRIEMRLSRRIVARAQ